MSDSHLERLYIFCVMWSVGALLELDDRAKMEEFARENFELDLPPIDEGSQDTIFEFLVNEAGSLLLPACIIASCLFRFDLDEMYGTFFSRAKRADKRRYICLRKIFPRLNRELWKHLCKNSHCLLLNRVSIAIFI